MNCLKEVRKFLMLNKNFISELNLNYSTLIKRINRNSLVLFTILILIFSQIMVSDYKSTLYFSSTITLVYLISSFVIKTFFYFVLIFFRKKLI
jgi:hypothetical protein